LNYATNPASPPLDYRTITLCARAHNVAYPGPLTGRLSPSNAALPPRPDRRSVGTMAGRPSASGPPGQCVSLFFPPTPFAPTLLLFSPPTSPPETDFFPEVTRLMPRLDLFPLGCQPGVEFVRGLLLRFEDHQRRLTRVLDVPLHFPSTSPQDDAGSQQV